MAQNHRDKPKPMTDAKHIGKLTPKQEGGLLALSYLAEVKRRNEAEPCYLYLMEAEGSGFCKVGISANPEKRAKDIQGSNPFKVKVTLKAPLHGYENNRKAAEEFEGMCHRALNPFKSKNAKEWFELPIGVAEQLIEGMALLINRAQEGRA